jgi:hypothetical protein
MIAPILLLALLQSSPNTLTDAERAAGWRLLFDGRGFTGWRGLGRDTVPTAHWVIENGAIKKVASGIIANRSGGLPPVTGGDLMTVDTFADFELTWEWKVTPGANSGVKYNVSEPLSKSLSGYAALGFEYQILDDDRHEDAKLATHRAGALYDLFAPGAGKALRPVGEWNQSKIVFRGNHGEHWLNGVKVVEYELGSPDWEARVKASKFATHARYGRNPEGYIGLQEHEFRVAYRNIKIRVLP